MNLQDHDAEYTKLKLGQFHCACYFDPRSLNKKAVSPRARVRWRFFLVFLHCLLFFLIFVVEVQAQTSDGTSASNTQSGAQILASAVNSVNVNGSLNAALFSGSDIGVKVQTAISSLPDKCGEIIIPAGTYSFSHTIVKPRCVTIKGQSAFATVLKYTPTTGWALVIGDALGSAGGAFNYPEGEVADLTLSGPGIGTTAGGIYVGGSDGAMNSPSILIDPATNYGDHVNLNRVRRALFGVGLQFGNNVWSFSDNQSLITNNGTGVSLPIGLGNAGERIAFYGTSIQNNTTGMSLLGFSDFYFYGVSCDYNTTCGTVNFAHFFGSHLEQLMGTLLTEVGTTAQPSVEFYGGWAQLAAPTGTDAQMFYINSALNPSFKMIGTFLISSHTVKQAVNWNGTGGGALLDIEGLPYHPTVPILTNTPCNFYGCTIFDQADTGTYKFDGASFLAGVLTLSSVQGARQGPLVVSPGPDSSTYDLVVRNATHTADTLYVFDTGNIQPGKGGTYLLNGAPVIPRFANNYHGGTSGLNVQMSDGTGSRQPAFLDAQGNVTGTANYGKTLANCGTITTTAATTNMLSCPWVTTSSNCQASQQSGTAVPFTLVTPTAGRVTVTHEAKSGAVYSIACSAD